MIRNNRAGGLPGGVGHIIQREKIDVAKQVCAELNQRLKVFFAIVYPFDKKIFKGYAAICSAGVLL